MFFLYLPVEVSDQDNLNGRTRAPLFLKLCPTQINLAHRGKPCYFDISLITNSSSKETKHHFILFVGSGEAVEQISKCFKSLSFPCIRVPSRKCCTDQVTHFKENYVKNLQNATLYFQDKVILANVITSW